MDIKKLTTDYKDIDVNTGRIILPSAEYLEQVNAHVSKSELQKNAVMPTPESSGTPFEEDSAQSVRQLAAGNEAYVNMSNNHSHNHNHSREFESVGNTSAPVAAIDESAKGWLLTPLMLTGLCLCFVALLIGGTWLFLLNESNHSNKDAQLVELSEERNALLLESLDKENSALKADLLTLKVEVDKKDTQLLELSEESNALFFEVLDKENAALKADLLVLKVEIDKIDQQQIVQAIRARALTKAVGSIEAAVFSYEEEESNVIPADETASEVYIIQE